MDTISTSQALQIAGRAGRSDSVLNTSVVFKVKKNMKRFIGSICLILFPDAGFPPILRKEK